MKFDWPKERILGTVPVPVLFPRMAVRGVCVPDDVAGRDLKFALTLVTRASRRRVSPLCSGHLRVGRRFWLECHNGV
jgi:hypothetical protein